MDTIEAIEIGVSRQDIDDVFTKDYSPEKLICLLVKGCKVQIAGELINIYDQSVHVGSLTLSQHSLAVLKRFEDFFAHRNIPGGIDINFFRLVLAMHDIGKPIGGIYGQTQETLTLVKALLNYFKYPSNLIQFALALLSADPIGYHLRGEATHKDLIVVAQEICDMATDSGLPRKDFFDLLMIYYTVDASSYEHLSSRFRIDHENKKIEYSPAIAGGIASIREAVFSTL